MNEPLLLLHEYQLVLMQNEQNHNHFEFLSSVHRKKKNSDKRETKVRGKRAYSIKL
jgi:hypothetical protein